MIKPWRSVRSNIPQSYRIFSIRTETAVSPRTGTEHDFYIIESRDWAKIGEVNPNPALFNNRCHTYLARNVKKVRAPSFDQTEDIEEVLIPLPDIPGMIRRGEIDHAIVITAFSFYFLRAYEGVSFR